MTNVITTAEQDFEAVVDKMLGHFKSLISFAGTQRDKLDSVGTDLGALSAKVETDVLGKLDAYEQQIRDSIMQPIMDKIAAVEADFGAQIAALTGGSTPAAATPASGTATADPVPAPAQAPTVTTSGSTTITVDPAAGTTTAADASAGTTTVLDHTTGNATTTHDATGGIVTPDPAVVAAAVAATSAAGVAAPTA